MSDEYTPTSAELRRLFLDAGAYNRGLAAVYQAGKAAAMDGVVDCPACSAQLLLSALVNDGYEDMGSGGD